jgi:hypothetical protein
VKTQRCYLRKRRGVLCVDVVAECDRYEGERWERGVCTGKECVLVMLRSSSLAVESVGSCAILAAMHAMSLFGCGVAGLIASDSPFLAAPDFQRCLHVWMGM